MTSASGMKRPVDVANFKIAIRDMGDDELGRVKQEVENSIRHLTRSNERLHRYIKKLQGHAVELEDGGEMDENLGSDDIELFQESIRENELVLDNSRERLEALHDELAYRKAQHPDGKSNPEDSLAERKLSAIDMDNTNVDVAAPNSIYL